MEEPANTDEIEIDEIQIQSLEEDVKLMAQKIADFRQTLPDQLKDTLASIISAQRPSNLTSLDSDSDPDPGPSDVRTHLGSEDPEHTEKVQIEDPEHTEKVQMIKQKISNNASAMPLLVKRMKACVSRMDQLDSFNQDMIHPAFTRKRSTLEENLNQI